MDQSSGARPLAPAPGPLGRGVERNLPPKRGVTITACTACKARKQKCRGGPPCENCAKTGSECIIDEENDMRRKKAVKRKIGELEGCQYLFDDLMHTLRRSSDEKALQLVNLIRSDAPLEEVKNFLDRRLDRAELKRAPELQEVQNQIAEYQGMPPRPDPTYMMDIRRIADNPPYSVPASPWTTITGDDGLVSHLVSLWLTWCRPIWNCLDQDLFLRDMQGARLDCEFCTPFLVNSILAEACYYSDYPECFTIPGDVTSRGAHFYDEARRLLEKEAGRVSIPTLQGIATLTACAGAMGKDRLGRMYLGMASRAVDEYSLCQRAAAEKSEGVLSDMDRATNNTVWGVFNVATMSCFGTMKITSLDPPQRPRLSSNHEGNDMWSPYPGSHDSTAAHTACVFNSYCDFNCIQFEICQSLFSADNRPPGPELYPTVNMFYERLRRWREQLPPCVSAENLSAPHILILHIFYHTSVLQIYVFLRNIAPEDDGPGGAASTKETCSLAAREISLLTGIHRSKWGIERMSSSAIQGVMAGLFALLDDLASAKSRAAFIELCTVARAFARRWTLARGILRMIQITADQKGVPIPNEVRALLEDFESQSWRSEDRERLSSGYPNFATILRPGQAAADYEMDGFLEKWDKLHV